MAERAIQTSKRLAAMRQIHAAISHFREGEFECVITLCSAAEGQLPTQGEQIDLFSILKQAGIKRPESDGGRDDFNFIANWMKHEGGPAEAIIEPWMALMWLNRAISRYRVAYGAGTPQMVNLFAWAAQKPD